MPIRSIFAFPLRVGPLHVGVIDMYSLTAGLLDATQISGARRLSEQLARHVLRDVLVMLASDPDFDDTNEFSRRVVQQATGMVIVQLDVTADDAHLVLRGHAYATGRSVMDVAEDVVGRRLDFSVIGKEM